MRNIFAMVIMLILLSGCSANNANGGQSNEIWDYKEGYVMAKESPKILVVQNSDMTEFEEKSIDEILNAVDPNAIWITAENESDLDAIEVGDKVSLDIEGEVEQSAPAETTAKQITKISTEE
ncbi:DUF3221 domain-containing protein [Paenibacillus sp. sgz302251]|uniref:DUF3221 domain-containing protein n=1 Tax=Paenibacillus sp. sgz302251 TaxID=3414493 RepID=UPI003C7A1835